MGIHLIYEMEDNVKVALVLAIAEKAFETININDIRYSDGRNALDSCWNWVESQGISANELYELIDNEDFTGISEFAEDEDDINIARLWSLLVDAVSYTSWQAYKKEQTQYLPQALEGIKEESLEVYMQSAVETTFINYDELQHMKENLIKDYHDFNGVILTKEYFIIKVND